MASTPSERSLAASIAANTRWAREDGTAQAEKGQAGLLARFEREVDPEGLLTPPERLRRAEALRLAHMQRLALASAKARRAKKEADALAADLGIAIVEGGAA